MKKLIPVKNFVIQAQIRSLTLTEVKEVLDRDPVIKALLDAAKGNKKGDKKGE